MCNCEKPYLKFAKTNEKAIVPSKLPENSGYDIYANIDKDYLINPHTTRPIPTGIACAVPQDWTFLFEERGSTGSKGIKKSAGVIDSNFRGEMFVCITNCTYKYIVFSVDPERTKEYLLKYREDYCRRKFGKDFDPEIAKVADYVEKNYIVYPVSKAICQGLLVYTPHVEPEEISYDELVAIPSNRGTGCLGSTGK